MEKEHDQVEELGGIERLRNEPDAASATFRHQRIAWKNSISRATSL